MKLLKELGIEQYLGTYRFLIGHEETALRNTLIELISRSFTFYWQRTGINKDAQLKHLRKTYLTALVEHFGDKAPMSVTIQEYRFLRITMSMIRGWYPLVRIFRFLEIKKNSVFHCINSEFN